MIIRVQNIVAYIRSRIKGKGRTEEDAAETGNT